MRYALLKYATPNLGDEIQSLAVKPFLPRVDCYVDRDNLNAHSFPERPKLVLNGWFTHNPERWPPDENRYDALMTSFHTSGELGGSIEAMTRPISLAYYRSHQPVGCRDYFTRDLLRAHGIEAFYSGCLTLTLERDNTRPRSDRILAVDVPEPILERLVPSAAQRGQIKRLSPFGLNRTRRLLAMAGLRRPISFFLAQRLLDAYADARFVITSKLHCAMPCLAFGTPVVFLLPSGEDPRFAPLAQLCHTFTYDQIEHFPHAIDIECPAPNPSDIAALVKSLKSQVKTFVQSAASPAV